MPFGRLVVKHHIRRYRRSFDDLCRQDGALCFFESFDHLFQAGHLGINDVVRQEHGKGLIAHKFARH